jgi:hypothetical protein
VVDILEEEETKGIKGTGKDKLWNKGRRPYPRRCKVT